MVADGVDTYDDAYGYWDKEQHHVAEYEVGHTLNIFFLDNFIL